ncbi:MAG: DHA2 family efflux MFS transporter permease subunit [Anaerolineaceae bacterium]|nr:DHA2 family efflux MFS transporter permease subunit [Anaerolineaceae bacterium]
MESFENRTVSAGKRQLAPKWRVLISVIFGIFMVILDTTVVNIAFPTLRAEFGASLNDSQWIISIYVLSIGIGTPLSGYLSDRFGMKLTYLLGLGIFIVGSFICGISPTLPILIAARAFQGFGGGIALPLGAAFLMGTFPATEQGLALGIFGIAALVAPAVGPILGGYLVDQGLWRYIFFINPPIGLLGIILGLRFLPNLKPQHKPSLDILGLITEVIGFGAVLYAASVAAYQGWSAPNVWLWFGIGGLGLAAFAIVELFFAKDPLLDLRLFGKRVFLNASLLGYVSVIALFGAEFLLPIYLQTIRGITAFQTGLIIVPMAITGGAAALLAGRLYDKIGPRLLIAFGFAVLMINTWQLSQLKAGTPVSWIMFLLALRGLALGSTVQTTFVTALSVVPLPKIARGSSLTNATRQVVQAIGVAILATVLVSTLSPQVAALQQQALEAPIQPGAKPVALCPVGTNVIPATGGGITKADPPAANSSDPSSNAQLLAAACDQSIAGFERAYKVTFYAAILALVLGLMLPGWPFKWGGRRAADAPPPVL